MFPSFNFLIYANVHCNTAVGPMIRSKGYVQYVSVDNLQDQPAKLKVHLRLLEGKKWLHISPARTNFLN